MGVAMVFARDAGRVKGPNGPPGIRVLTPPAVAAVSSTRLARVTSLCGRAGQRAMAGREERLTGPG